MISSDNSKPTKVLRLNLGCGSDSREGYLNVDSCNLPGVDLVCDLSIRPWPFESSSVGYILAKDVAEHLPDVAEFLRESHRVLAPGGTIEIVAPHFTSRGAWADPTHRRSFTFDSFDFFVGGHGRSYYWDFGFSERDSAVIRFEQSGPYPWNHALEAVVNRSDRTRRFYESTPLRIFPALNVAVTLVK